MIRTDIAQNRELTQHPVFLSMLEQIQLAADRYEQAPNEITRYELCRLEQVFVLSARTAGITA